MAEIFDDNSTEEFNAQKEIGARTTRKESEAEVVPKESEAGAALNESKTGTILEQAKDVPETEDVPEETEDAPEETKLTLTKKTRKPKKKKQFPSNSPT